MFTGKSFGAKANVSGEAVFTTSLVGSVFFLIPISSQLTVLAIPNHSQIHHIVSYPSFIAGRSIKCLVYITMITSAYPQF